MKNFDEAIDRVLTGLRKAEAPEGMERRILKTVSDRASEQREWNPMRLVLPSRLIATRSWTVAAAGVAVVSLLFGWAAFRQHRPAQDIAGPNQHMLPANVPGPAVQAETAKVILPLHEGSTSRWKGNANTKRVEAVLDGDSVALSEMHAASYPAPPMPLTEQEKLLLRIAHKGDPEELAMLNTEVRARQEAEGKTQFQKFFEPSTTGDNE